MPRNFIFLLQYCWSGVSQRQKTILAPSVHKGPPMTCNSQTIIAPNHCKALGLNRNMINGQTYTFKFTEKMNKPDCCFPGAKINSARKSFYQLMFTRKLTTLHRVLKLMPISLAIK